MPPTQVNYTTGPAATPSVVREGGIEKTFIERLRGLKYDIRPDITDRASLERNFWAKFEELNRVRLTDADCPARQRPPTTRSHPAESERSDGQFARLLDEIVEYKNDPGNGYTKTLLCFLQLFIVSNRDQTFYFANNNARHFAFNAEERFLPVYEFADEANRKIRHLDDFTDAFLPKCALAKTISRYMVLIVSEQKLMIMRPYQVYAVKQMVKCIEDDAGNGYVWHTTGSGKTLTSFKASTLLKDKINIALAA